MTKYHLWDVIVDSDMEFPELLTALPNPASHIVSLCRSPLIGIAGKPYNVWNDRNGTPLVRFEIYKGCYLVKFLERFYFLINLPSRVISYDFLQCCGEDSLRHQILNLAFPLFFSGKHRFVLHGSVLAQGGQSIALVGKGGSGKSTLAAGLTTKRNYALLADDSVYVQRRIDGSYAYPAYDSLRLTKTSLRLLDAEFKMGEGFEEEKKDHRSGAFENTSCILRGIYFINNDVDDPSIEVLSLRESFLNCVGHGHILDPFDSSFMRAHFRNVQEIVPSVRIFLFSYPKKFELFDSSLSILHNHISEVIR